MWPSFFGTSAVALYPVIRQGAVTLCVGQADATSGHHSSGHDYLKRFGTLML